MSVNPTVLDAFLDDLKAVKDRLIFANDYLGATSPGVGQDPPIIGGLVDDGSPKIDQFPGGSGGRTKASSASRPKHGVVALALVFACIMLA